MVSTFFNQAMMASQLNPAITAWCQRVKGPLGSVTPELRAKVAINNLYNALVNTTIFPKIKSLVPMVIGEKVFLSQDLTAVFTPIIKTTGNDPWNNQGLTVANTTINGPKGGGAHVKTGINPSVAFANTSSVGITLYITETNTDATTDFGCFTVSSYEPGVVLDVGYAGTTYWDAFYGNGSGRTSVANSGFTGYLSANRTAGNFSVVYIANSVTPHQALVTNTNPVVGAVVPNIEMYFYATKDSSGNTTAPCSRRFSFAAVHEGLTAAESQQFYNIIQKYRQTVGGGYI